MWCEKYGSAIDDNAYFPDGCVAAFDAAGEWVVDADGHLLLRLPSGYSDISAVSITGKVQAFALAFSQCDGLTVSGLNFFATTFLAFDSSGVNITNNTFTYPSASRRSTGGDAEEYDVVANYDMNTGVANQGLRPEPGKYEIVIPSTFIGCRSWIGVKTASNVVDNSVFYSEGAAFYCAYCQGDLFENNDVMQAGYPYGRALQFGGLERTT